MQEADGIELVKIGSFKGAGGTGIDNFGRFKVPAEDVEGWRRDFKAFVADIHKPLGSAAEFSDSHDSILWHDGGALFSQERPDSCWLAKRVLEVEAYPWRLPRNSALSRRTALQLLLETERCFDETFFFGAQCAR